MSYADARLDICKGCEHFFHLAKACKRCGCFMPFKAQLAGSSCPDGKWMAIADVENCSDCNKDKK